MQFREYQREIIDQGTDIIRKNGFLYLSMQVIKREYYGVLD